MEVVEVIEDGAGPDLFNGLVKSRDRNHWGGRDRAIIAMPPGTKGQCDQDRVAGDQGLICRSKFTISPLICRACFPVAIHPFLWNGVVRKIYRPTELQNGILLPCGKASPIQVQFKDAHRIQTRRADFKTTGHDSEEVYH